MTDLTVREYEPRDTEAVWDLHERALRDAGVFDPEPTDLDADLKRIEDAYFDDGGTFPVGERDGAVVAMGAVRPVAAGKTHEARPPFDYADYVPDPSTAAALKRMRVDPEWYRQGFGSAILARLETWAADAGFETLVLDTQPTQERAVAFYESHGFERVARDSFEHATLVFYRKSI